MSETKKTNTKISINLDTTPILYTDNVNVAVNSDGVTLNVLQRVGVGNQIRIVSRIGMSHEHARKLVEKLGSLLLKTENKIVPGKKVLV